MQVNDYNTSKEVWDKLNEIYCLTYPAYKIMLVKQLVNYKMQEDGNINSHIRNFSDLIDKLREIHIYIQDDIEQFCYYVVFQTAKKISGLLLKLRKNFHPLKH